MFPVLRRSKSLTLTNISQSVKTFKPALLNEFLVVESLLFCHLFQFLFGCLGFWVVRGLAGPAVVDLGLGLDAGESAIYLLSTA